MSGIPMVYEKCAGAFIASAIGDALGWPNEFRASNINKKAKSTSSFIEWQRRSGGRFWSHTENILVGEYSDDTQMNLAVARSILSGKPWVTHMSTVELPFWLEYERGGGSALKRAAELWKKNCPPWRSSGDDLRRYFQAGGNGAAMRVLPHVITGFQKEYSNLAIEIAQDAMLTHGHPRAIIGALCYAYALFYLFTKNNILSYGELVNAVISSKNEWGAIPSSLDAQWLNTAGDNYLIEWSNTIDEMIIQLNRVSEALNKGALDSENETLNILGCFNKNINGAGDVAAIASIYLASKYANNPVLGIKSAANTFGMDTDTIASMVGGLLGALMGLSWIPSEWKMIQDFDCLMRMAEFLINNDGIAKTKDFVSKSLSESPDWEKSPIGKLRKISTISLPSGDTGTITISKYVTILGQTIYIKKMARKKALEKNNKQQLLTKQYVLRLESNRIDEVRLNTEFGKLSVAQLYEVMNLMIIGDINIQKVAMKLGISEHTAKFLIEIITVE